MNKIKDFDRFGVMLDCSRNGVKTVQELCRFVDLLRPMGYNTILLYTEDTYEISGQPYFGYLRGRYSKEELKEIDRYAAARGMEVIPCIQTLAHLNGLVHWPVYQPIVDCNDILLAGEEKTYDLIDAMFATLEECFTTRLVNIGLDEADMVGLGAYLRKNGYENRHDIFRRHLTRVREIAAAHGFRVMMWSDMFFRFQNDGKYQMTDPVLPAELAESVPEELDLVYWDYYDWGDNEAHYDSMFRAHEKFRGTVWYAGGAWTWSGYSPRNYLAERVLDVAMPLCKAHGVRNLFMTMWGDDGCACSYRAALPALYYASQLARGITDKAQIEQGFEAMMGMPYEAFKLLDLPGTVGCENGWLKNPEKYMLFSDPFLGMFDSTVVPGDGKRYEEFAEAMAPWCTHPRWGSLFRAEQALCRVLAEKFELGCRLRRCYGEDDRPGLKQLAETCRKTARLVSEFCGQSRRLWMEQNKPYGFETQELRLGGLALRLESCAQRVEDYLAGAISCIEELEEPMLDAEGGGTQLAHRPVYQNTWRTIATPNLL